MAVYTTVEEQEIAAFAARYGLRLRSAKGIAQGVENTNYLLVAARDGEERRYILTLYEKRVEEADLPFFMALMERLSSHGFPSPVPLRAADGQALQRLKDRPAAIVSFLEGEGARFIRNAHLSELGRAMAQMHEAAQGLTPTRRNTLSVEGWRLLFDKTRDRLDDIQPGLAREVEAELIHLTHHWPSVLPEGVIHADVFPDNVFFIGERLTGVIDFYFACHDFLAYDLAICLNAWCFEQQREFNMTKSKLMLEAYDRVRPLTVAETEALPLLARGAALRFLLTRAHDWLFRVEGALVTPKDPLEYWRKLRFHQSVSGPGDYGL